MALSTRTTPALNPISSTGQSGYLNLGPVLCARERFREAADCFRETIRIDPENRTARRASRDVERGIKLVEG